MICKFCRQWNIEDSRRCIFCQNEFQADEDKTSGGHRYMSEDQLAALPEVKRSMFDYQTSRRAKVGPLTINGIALKSIVSVVFFFGFLIYLRYCR